MKLHAAVPYDDRVGMWTSRKRNSEQFATPTRNEEISETLRTALLSNEDDSLIILPGEIVAFQSPGIATMGLLRDGRLEAEELLALVRLVRRTGELRRGNIEVPRGPIGEGKRTLHITA